MLLLKVREVRVRKLRVRVRVRVRKLRVRKLRVRKLRVRAKTGFFLFYLVLILEDRVRARVRCRNSIGERTGTRRDWVGNKRLLNVSPRL